MLANDALVNKLAEQGIASVAATTGASYTNSSTFN